jgi:tetratricopeptide (TPR) repeat protein
MRLPSLLLLVLLLGRVASAADAGDLGRRWAVYGQGLAAQGRGAEAEQAFEKALNLAPGDAAVLRARGQWRWTQGRKDEALADLRGSLAADPSQTALADWLAKAAGPAAAPVQAAPAPAVDDSEALEEARANLESRDFGAVLDAVAEAGAAAKRSADWQRLKAEALYGSARFDEARQALALARQAAPEDAALKALESRYFHDGLAPDQGGGSPWGSLARSAVLPGWGQARNGERRKALWVGTITLGLLAGTVATYVAADQALADYRALGPGTPASDFDAAFGRADGMAVLNQVLGISFYSAYAYNLFDAASHARPAVAAQAGGLKVTLLAAHF